MTAAQTIDLGPSLKIEGGEGFAHIERRLREAFPQLHIRKSGGGAELSLVPDLALAEGAFRYRCEVADGAPRLTINASGVSGMIYAIEDVIARSPAGRPRAARDVSQKPGLAYRTFWTWDHSTNWELSQIGQQEIGVFNPFQKPPRGFLDDYKRLVGWCSRHRIAAVTIYGFLRNSHGGIAAAQELARYAKERGVRILPGIAIGAYGGVYWEGDHPFNLATWLKKHPQFSAQLEKGIGFQLQDLAFPLNFPASDYTMTACPSAPETMDWMTEAVSWLAETFDIGGVNIESGDYGVCGCARCRARRANEAEAARRGDTYGDSWSHTDMASNFPRLYAAAKAKKPDLWMYCEMQWDNLLNPVASEVQKRLPRGGIYQYTANKSFWAKLRTRLKRDYVKALPTQPNVLRCQFACQWNGDERTERYALNARTFADMASIGYREGMQGLTVWGEPSPYFATVEVSYLAFARFCWEPTLTWERFVGEDLAPLFGGREAADRFIAIAEEIDAHQRLPVERLEALAKETRRAAADASGETAHRWTSLADHISRRAYMGT